MALHNKLQCGKLSPGEAGKAFVIVDCLSSICYFVDREASSNSQLKIPNNQ
jgi:hypothetical protein